MLPITSDKDQRTLKVIISFIHAGGHIKGIKNMEEFCAKYSIDIGKFEESCKQETPELILFKLEKAGLL